MNLANKIDFDTLKIKKNNKEIKKIFFYRVCGTGMGAAACLLKEAGYEVEGGDINFYPPMSTYLESTKILLFKLDDISTEKLKEYDLIVVGNVVPRMSDDARMIEELGVPFCSFPQALGALVLDKINVVGLSGTHGKTTTTYLATQIFEKLGQKPGYLVGGVMEGRPSAKLGDGKYFFIESDEYDSAYFEKISKFRLYSLNSVVLTSLEFDHADIFDSIEDIKDEFKAMLKNVNGRLIFNSDYKAIKELVQEMNLSPTYYGLDCKDGPIFVEESEKGTTFKLNLGREVEFRTDLIGKHNILNLTSIIYYAHQEGFDLEDIKHAIENLSLVKRRQEVRGFFKGAPVIDDFAHHPRAVDLTIDAIRTRFPDRKIVVVMEPNSATARSSLFEDEFKEALLSADTVIYTKPVRSTSVKGAKDIDYNRIVNEINAVEEKSAFVASKLSELESLLSENIDNESLLLVLSNGTCLGLWESEFVKAISV